MKINRKTLLSLSLILLTGCAQEQDVPLPVTSSSTRAIELHREARIHQNSWEWVEAGEDFQAALRIDPEFVLANLYGVHSDPAVVRNYRQAAIANKSKVSKAEQLQVDIVVAQAEGRSEDAVKLAKELVQLHPESSESFVLLGNAYTSMLDFENAIAAYNDALFINSKNFEAWFGLFTHQITINANFTLAPEELRSREKAIQYADGMIKSMPDNPGGYHMRANIERQHRDFKEADKYYQKALTICEQRNSSAKANVLNVTAHNLMFGGDHEKAVVHYDRSFQAAENPGFKRAVRRFKSASYLFTDSYSGALNVIEEANDDLESWGFSKAAYLQTKAIFAYDKFYILAHMQEKADALSALEQSHKYSRAAQSEINADENQIRNTESQFLRQLAWYHTLFAEFDQAEEKLAQHYEMQKKKQDPSAMDHYNALTGMVHLMKGNARAAEPFFTDNITVLNYPYYAYFKGLTLKMAGNVQEAEKIFTDISNYTFARWEAALVRNLASKQLSD